LPFAGTPGQIAVGFWLAQALDCRWEAYREQLRHCQEQPSEEAVHEVRVAGRRLLAQFSLLDCIGLTPAVEKARRILKRRLAALGDLRDTQVQGRFIDQKLASFPELVLLRSWLARRERRLIKSAASQVKRFKTRKLERCISPLITDLTANAGTPRADSLQAAAVLRATSRAFAEAVERRQAIDLADPGTIHQTRVAFKRFRYMVESLSPALTGFSKRQLRPLAYYQRKMGIIQDLEVMQACVARYLRQNPGSEDLLRPFWRHLRQRRARALRSFLKTADHLRQFWPPNQLTMPGEFT
jgi:CHAD domain-containing protein